MEIRVVKLLQFSVSDYLGIIPIKLELLLIDYIQKYVVVLEYKAFKEGEFLTG